MRGVEGSRFSGRFEVANTNFYVKLIHRRLACSHHRVEPTITDNNNLNPLGMLTDELKEYPVEARKLRLSLLNNLSNNSLSGLPPELGQMTTLRQLLLTGNPIRTLRSTLVSGSTPALLKYLRSRLSENEDAEGTSTRKEDELSMEGVGLSAVPSEVWESTELIKVDLSRNSIQELPVELSSCINLQCTRLPLYAGSGRGECRLVLPPFMERLLPSLEPETYRSWAKALAIAPSATSDLVILLVTIILWLDFRSFMHCLGTLILSRNKITHWPGAILQSLPNLLCMKLDNNPLRQIPPGGFQAAPMLQILDLSGNVASLPEHPAFSSLPHLQELYLRQMQLREVPSEVLSLQQLRILDLSQNSLQLVPVEFKNLASLTELGLSDNNISMLSPEGLLEPSLQALRLDGNPLRSIRRTVLDRGTKVVLQYLKDKIVED
ncbi:hypothetical protein DVH24_003605 [Malus domestica]|uniref:Uncharacterized protein n=1 Tax=Malus domestica TaxID=3750 RepID=A0A498ILZ8_MALDO|nr:hypothetical protein DVH24_003605 [Malus domestica]